MDKKALIRFLNGLSPVEEAARIKRWLDQPNSKEEIERFFLEDWDGPLDDVNKEELDEILKRIHHEVKKGKKPLKPVNVSFYLKVAASIVLVCSLAFVFYKISNENVINKQEEPVTVNYRETKVGEKLKLFLPDRTYVVLNSSSSIEFDSGYGKVNRNIKIQGEAYFKVSKIDKLPFIVDSGELTTTAIGTEFNVSTRDGIEEIALSEGEVLVQSEADYYSALELSPGESALLSQNQLKSRSFDPHAKMAWKEGIIKFKNKSLKDIFSDLETWYGVTIAVPNDLNLNRKISGEFNNENLENVLHGLSFSMGFKFKLYENTVTIDKVSSPAK